MSWCGNDGRTVRRFSARGRDRRDLPDGRGRALAGASGRRRLLGGLVRPVSCPHAGARAGGRQPQRSGRPRQGRRRREPGPLLGVSRSGHPGRQGVQGRPRRLRVRRRPLARRGRGVLRRAARSAAVSSASSRSCARAETCRKCCRRSRPEIAQRALDAVFAEIADATPERRERLREVAVAVFQHLGQDDPTTVAYRRRLAAALY